MKNPEPTRTGMLPVNSRSPESLSHGLTQLRSLAGEASADLGAQAGLPDDEAHDSIAIRAYN